MIYCVIPPELADELYDRLVEHYRDNPNVQVIIDRRASDRRASQERAGIEVPEDVRNRRQVRDRRRSRPGSFPRVYEPGAGSDAASGAASDDAGSDAASSS